jgi:hypothetical protein
MATSMSEIFGWFDQHNRDQLDILIREYEVKTVLEIGTFLGLSAAWFAERVDHVYCVDKFEEQDTRDSELSVYRWLVERNIPAQFFDTFRQNMQDAGVWNKITPLRGWSADVVDLAPVVDLVYVDGDHTKFGCGRDIQLYLPKARLVICGDDYVSYKSEYGVIQAVTELLPAHKSYGPFWYYENEKYQHDYLQHESRSSVRCIAPKHQATCCLALATNDTIPVY